MKVLIIHGYAGYPEENWFPWLQEQLQHIGHDVFVPPFPTPENQTLESWRAVLAEVPIDKDTIVIGHSLGGAFLLDILERHRLAGAVFVAAVSGPIPRPVDKEITEFTHRRFDWPAIVRNVEAVAVYHSDDDPFIPLAQARSLAKRFGTAVQVMENGGHLNAASGFVEFPALLETVLTFIKQR